MAVANLASPITPFSSTIRPWTSLVCKITVSFSSLLVDSAGAEVADVAGVATTAELSAGVVASSA